MKNKIIVMSILFAACELGGYGLLFAQQQPPPAQQQPAQPQQQPASGQQEVKKELTAPAPVLEIKRLEAEQPLYSIELRDVQLADLFRVIAHDYNLNIVIDPELTGTVTASFTSIPLEEALQAIAELRDLTIERKGALIKVSPNLITKTFVLKYIEAKKVMEGSTAGQSEAAGTGTATTSSPAAATVSSGTGLYSLLSDKGKAFLAQQQNAITIIDYPRHVASVEEYLGVIDQKMQVKTFKLKYLKASEVMGQTSTTTTAPASVQTSLSAPSSSQ
jgi:type II secretory pathway component HofQ